MREHGIRARHKRRHKVTTYSNYALPVADNLLDINFIRRLRIKRGLRTSCIYGRTKAGSIWLSCLIHSMVSDWLVARTTYDQLHRNGRLDDVVVPPWAMHHSDRDSEYASHAFQSKRKEFAGTARRLRAGSIASRMSDIVEFIKQPMTQ